MDIQERRKLKEKYKEFSNEALLDMLLEGKQAYVEGAYELLLQEAKDRGLEDKLEQMRKVEKQTCGAPSNKVGEEAKTDTYVELVIIKSEQDYAFLKSVLEGTDIAYYFQSLSLRGKDMPVALMIEESRVSETIELFKDFQSHESIILW